MAIDQSTIRKHLQTSLRLLKKRSDVTIRSQRLHPKAKPDKLASWIEKAGATVSEETRAWLCEVGGLELSWYRGDNQPDEDDWSAFSRVLGDHRAKIGSPVGHVDLRSWRTTFNDKNWNASNFAPHHRRLDYFYSTQRDDYFQVVHLDITPGREALVRFGDDHGADFASSIPCTLPVYLKLMALTLGQGRKALLCRGSGKDYPVLDNPALLPDLDPKEVIGLAIDRDAGLRARFDEAVAKIHAGAR